MLSSSIASIPLETCHSSVSTLVTLHIHIQYSQRVCIGCAASPTFSFPPAFSICVQRSLMPSPLINISLDQAYEVTGRSIAIFHPNHQHHKHHGRCRTIRKPTSTSAIGHATQPGLRQRLSPVQINRCSSLHRRGCLLTLRGEEARRIRQIVRHWQGRRGKGNGGGTRKRRCRQGWLERHRFGSIWNGWVCTARK